MSGIDSSQLIGGVSSTLASLDSGRIPASRRRYQSASVEHAARDVSGANVASPALQAPEAGLDAASLGPMLLAIKSKLANEQVKSSREDIKANMQRQKAEHEKMLKQIEKALKAMRKARSALGKLKSAGLFGKIFSWVSTVAMAVAGAALIATGVGAVAGGVMIALAVNQAAGLLTGKTLMEQGVEGMGASNSTARWIELGITVAAIAVSAGIAGAGGAAQAAGSVSRIQEAAQVAVRAGQVTAAVAQGGKGGSTIAQGVYHKETAGYRKDAEEAAARKLEFQKFLAKLQAEQGDEQDRLRRVIEELNETTSRVLDMMGGERATTEQIARNLRA